jgi:hypothetical protein
VRRSAAIAKDIVRTRARTLTYLAPEGALHDGEAVGDLGAAIGPASPAMNCGSGPRPGQGHPAFQPGPGPAPRLQCRLAGLEPGCASTRPTR